MSTIPEIQFGPHKITRLIVGGNPFCGNSHFSEAMSREMADFYIAEKVVEVLQRCEEAGINTVQARGDYHRILHWLELYRRKGGNMHWIAQTASEMSDVFQNIRIIAAADAIGIYHHGSQTDTLWQQGKIDKVQDYLKCMRDCGVQVGLGTHIPEVICYSEDHDWDVDFYMACFYNISRQPRESNLVKGTFQLQEEEFRDDDAVQMCRIIRQTPKTCLAFKILAANRKCATQQSVQNAFRFAFDNIKNNDAVVVGMFPKTIDQISLNVSYARKALQNKQSALD
ncbi:hypothetical protein JXJ21_07730 [candidate division KSB1 bacterium]|nr:hypothetical protein [candidate division KSB1 bacterium]